MNANQIHPGEEYAIASQGKPNGNAFVPNALRLKAMRTFGEQEYGNKRLTMYVEGFLLDRESGDVLSTEYRRFRVRDVIEDWDEYEDRQDQYNYEMEKREQERAARAAEQRREWEQRERERQRLREERERAEAERRANALRVKQHILTQLSNRGLDIPEANIGEYNVQIPIATLMDWLNSLEKYDCTTCGKELLRLTLPAGMRID